MLLDGPRMHGPVLRVVYVSSNLKKQGNICPQGEGLLTACHNSGGYFKRNKWSSTSMQIHCMHGRHLGHITSPLRDLEVKETVVNMITLKQFAVP